MNSPTPPSRLEGILGSPTTCEVAQQSVNRFLPPKGPHLTADEFWNLIKTDGCIKYSILPKTTPTQKKCMRVSWKCKVTNMTRAIAYSFPVSVECDECGWVRTTQFYERCPNEKCEMS